jgi:hypothetical protein
MSWISQNYEKAALGGAAVLALGLAFLGWSKISGVEEEFNTHLKGAGNNDPSVRGADLVPQAIASLGLNRTWSQAEDDGRAVDLFTGIPLFVSRDAPNKALDLVEGESVHPPIPNVWWIENDLDPGFGDSPQRDPDQDGFSNLEEFKAETDPNSAESHPQLIAKLKYVKDETLTWVLRPGFESDGGFPFTYEDSARQTNRAGAAEIIMPGTVFFGEGAAKNRFKLLGSERRKELNPRIKVEVEVLYVRIEDQRANKKGTIYEIPSQFKEDLKMDYAQYDRTAILSLEAVGQSGTEFKVEENTMFSLPPGSSKKDYLLKKVTPEGIEVEYTDAAGTKKTVQIAKGSTP